MNVLLCSTAVSRIVGLTLIALLTGCAVGPDYKRPDLLVPATFADAPDMPDTSATAQQTLASNWWTLYDDATLNQLVEATLLNNADLRAALARIDEAAAVLDQVGSARLPSVDLEASSNRARTSTLSAQPLTAGTPAVSTTHRVALSTSFELDFWGKLRRNSEVATAQLIGTHYARDVSALTLAGATAQAYFTLRSLDAQITATHATLTSRDESLDAITFRASGGLASELEVYQAQGVRVDASLQLRELQRQRTLMEHQLGLLTGKPDLRIAAGNVMQMPLPLLPPAGLPSTLVERRPDVQQAEQALIAANAGIGVAKAARLPTFSLTGNFGGSSTAFSDILDSGARIWSLGVSGVLPVLNGGKHAARSREAEAVQRQALAAYQRSVEIAFKEVADALTNIEHSSAATRDLQIKFNAASNALRLSDLRYNAGYSGYLDVLDAQRSANAAELALVQGREAQLVYSVDLIKALGGGWSASDNVTAAR